MIIEDVVTIARLGKKEHLAGPNIPGHYKPTPEQIAAAKRRIQEQGIDITLRGCLQKGSSRINAPKEDEVVEDNATSSQST